MQKNISQKGAIEISSIAAIIIVAAIVGAVSVIATIKYYEILGDSAPAAVTTPKAVKPPIVDKIISSEATADCKIKINTTKGEVVLATELYTTLGVECHSLLLNKVSPSGKYVVFEDLSGGVDSALRVYSLKYNENIPTIAVLGTSTIFDIAFLPDDRLIALFGYKGIYNEQALSIYDILGLFTDYPKDVKNPSQYEKNITLPDIGEDYSSLSVSDNVLKIYGIGGINAGVLKEYHFDELMIKSGVDETADWKTYRNEEYGFELEYPKKWESPYQFLSPEEQNIIFSAGKSTEYLALEPGSSEPLRLVIKFFDKNRYTREPVEDYINPGKLIIPEEKQVMINGFNAKQYTYYSPGLESSLDIIHRIELLNNGNMYLLESVYVNCRANDDCRLESEKAASENEITRSQILSTFKFIKEDLSFSCGISTVSDIDNNIYNTVKIGEQCWLKENLKVTKNPAGEAIIRYCYDNDPKICETDGGLYDWNTAMNNSIEEGAQGICPSGWHVPKDSEWYELESGLATGECLSARYGVGCKTAGTKLKTGGISGFDNIFAGKRGTLGAFLYRNDDAYFWSSTEKKSLSWIRVLDSSFSNRFSQSKKFGFSIRCLKD